MKKRKDSFDAGPFPQPPFRTAFPRNIFPWMSPDDEDEDEDEDGTGNSADSKDDDEEK